jgi:hypothetical protein
MSSPARPAVTTSPASWDSLRAGQEPMVRVAAVEVPSPVVTVIVAVEPVAVALGRAEVEAGDRDRLPGGRRGRCTRRTH